MKNFLRPNLDPHALARELSGKHLIGGVTVPAASGKTFEVINPATGEAIGPQPGLSYGGFKRSGLGKEYSFEAMLDHFTQTKTIIINMA